MSNNFFHFVCVCTRQQRKTLARLYAIARGRPASPATTKVNALSRECTYNTIMSRIDNIFRFVCAPYGNARPLQGYAPLIEAKPPVWPRPERLLLKR